MARRLAVKNLNASTIDIMNVIRQNASYEYQSMVPKVEQATDIPKVGEIIYGNPGIANQFLYALVNRVALTRVSSAVFNNPYSVLKKGYLEFGETIEDIFVAIAKVVHFDIEKAPERELRRTLPDVRAAYYIINWKTMYPVTIQDEDLKQAFLSMDGVQRMIADIVQQVYTAAEYDEFLLFKYLLIKAIAHGKAYPVSIGDGTDMDEAAINFRGMANMLPFMSSEYNEAGVFTNTPRERTVIFMDAMYNAKYDVKVLAAAFNMDKADFMGRLFLIDNWASFDNDRWAEIRKESTGLEEVTAAELALMADVKAVLLDEDWFQFYDNLNKFTEKYAASGLYWNYFYHTRKTIAHSPFANLVVFTTSANIAPPASITVEVTGKEDSEEAVTLALNPETDGPTLAPDNALFTQTEAAVKDGIGITPYGAVLVPGSQAATEITLEATIGENTYTNAESPLTPGTAKVGDTITLNKQ